ncbi:MAG TPA: amidohydrolase [Membranihabitans sp.]|nr:amidohydrolase [Membranihabitans sp.]
MPHLPVSNLTLILVIFFTYGQLLYAQTNQKVLGYIDEIYPELWELYRHLHQAPELSMQEEKTARLIADQLTTLGFEVQENMGAFNLAAVYRNGSGPVVLIRTDMDALPVRESTGLAYASSATGTNAAGDQVSVMHACGHDMHMTVFLGTARTMVEMRDRWQGTLIMVAQSAEETGMGANLFFKNGLYEKVPLPDYALALHCNPYLEAGKVGYRSGPLLASVDMIDIEVLGEGGHGAAPHTTRDPVMLSAQLIQSFQTIVSREVNPQEPAVVTVGSIHGGTVHNVIPDKVHLQLTVRSYSDVVRDQIIEAIERRCRNLALAAGISEDKLPVIHIRDPHTPTTDNDPVLTERLVQVFQQELGAENVEEMPKYTFGEDFSRYGIQDHKVPICLYWLGTVDPEKVEAARQGGPELPSLHSPFYAPIPEPSIRTGVRTMTAAAFNLFGSK